MINNIINFLTDKNILILGFGMEGLSSYELIRKYLPNQALTIADQNESLIEKYPVLKEDKNLTLLTGPNYLANLEDYELIIKTPGISFKSLPNLENIREKLTSQLNLFLQFSNIKTIGITGSKGKSTTTSLIYEMIKNAGYKTFLVGNIGIPIFNEIYEMDNDTIVVIEMAALQLEYVNYSPNIAILLNLYEEHLDHFGTFSKYINAKFNIFNYQKEDDYAIYNIDNEHIAKFTNYQTNNQLQISFNKNDNYGFYYQDKGLYLVEDNQITLVYDTDQKRNLLGEHNLYNIMCAFAVGKILNIDNESIIKTITDFKPLPHRIEYVGKYYDIDWYNDSIATIPMATINCVKSIPNLETILLGGFNRGINLYELVDFLTKSSVKNIILMPHTGLTIYEIFSHLKHDKNLILVNDLKEAVIKAKEVTSKDMACALSPAAASYGFFKNFEERGDTFKKYIKEETL